MRKHKYTYRKSTSCLLVGVLVGMLFVISCRKTGYPKPYGFFRVDLPENTYVRMDTLLPYSFDMSSHAQIAFKYEPLEKYWIDIVYPALNAAIHCSYKEVKDKLYDLSEDAHRSVYKHLVRADDIQERFFSNPEQDVYGIYYDLQGDVASIAQFTLTDSIRHFFRGAVYFNHVPNKDSIAPMADFIKKDVIRLMESFSWK